MTFSNRRIWRFSRKSIFLRLQKPEHFSWENLPENMQEIPIYSDLLGWQTICFEKNTLSNCFYITNVLLNNLDEKIVKF